MTPAYIALLVGALSASSISLSNLRAIVWIFIAQMIFWVTVLYWDISGPLPFLFATLCDISLVYLIYKYGKYLWEKWLMFIFTLSILVNFSSQATITMVPEFNIYIYSWALYLLNWSAILYIGSISGLARVKSVKHYLAFTDWSTIFGRKRFVEKEASRK